MSQKYLHNYKLYSRLIDAELKKLGPKKPKPDFWGFNLAITSFHWEFEVNIESDGATVNLKFKFQHKGSTCIQNGGYMAPYLDFKVTIFFFIGSLRSPLSQMTHL